MQIAGHAGDAAAIRVHAVERFVLLGRGNCHEILRMTHKEQLV